ncbi:META domain-containing protein [Winogradskyella alexanderae]|uniref:META domain-containing protein n=1 Tax=Winogradskyella alexanderae TaxID=2877123 RepID=A0ABS7XTG9_9FLAO|nr:META domain-containing protein [Winogradskyella alexanderae]MCA0133318.1 META domain-containing protein [Winogradskyella alexanderae]
MKKNGIVFSILILITSCNSKESKTVMNTLLQSDWQLEKINGELLSDSMQIPMLQIDLAKMQLSGNTGCNSYTGSISELGEKDIVLENIATTLKMCVEGNYEDQYVNLMNQVKIYEVNDSSLTFKNSAEKVILEFKKYSGTKKNMRIHDIWSAVRVEGNPINRMVTVPRIEFNTTDMKFYGNDGCNEYFGTISKLSEEKITLGNVGSTRKMCPEMEFPQRYINALKNIDNYKFTDDNILVFFNKDEEEVLAFMKVD